MTEKTMWFIRGVSGSGKSTLAKKLKALMITIHNNNRNCMDEDICRHLEADMYFYDKYGNYHWDKLKLVDAHDWCKSEAKKACKSGTENIIISNTSVLTRDMIYYEALAEKYGYKFISLVVEKRHNNKNIHDVPETKLRRQEQRLLQSLKLL